MFASKKLLLVVFLFFFLYLFFTAIPRFVSAEEPCGEEWCDTTTPCKDVYGNVIGYQHCSGGWCVKCSGGGGGGPPPPPPPPVCNWGGWSGCSTYCGPGTQSRSDNCGNQQTQACQINDPNAWGGWSTCSVSCGTGTQSRTNACGTQQTQSCTINDPNVWGPWSGTCQYCGGPTSISRTNQCGQPQTQQCTPYLDPNVWGAWDGTCISCGGPTNISRINECGQSDSQQCTPYLDPNVWTVWSTCSLKCGTGTQNRTNQCGTVQNQDCNTQACPAWIKLKNSSFISPNSLSNMIASVPVPYDGDDTTEQYFIVGKDGVAMAPALDMEVSNLGSTAKTGNPEYKAIYSPDSFSLTPNSFLSYIKARKQYTAITNSNLSEITGSGIYVYAGDLTIASNSSPFNQASGYNIVLISTGTVTINPAPDNTFTPVGTVAIVASKINFNSSITEAQGVFIANEVTTGVNATQGLKVVGNLVAQTSLSNNREWPTFSKPSLFIKFDQAKYISLLPYLSTANYEWRQIR